jgi:hypothetical protein
MKPLILSLLLLSSCRSMSDVEIIEKIKFCNGQGLKAEGVRMFGMVFSVQCKYLRQE